MRAQKIAYLGLFAGGLLLAPGVTLSQDAAPKPHVPLEKSIGRVTPTGPVPSLAVLNAAGAKLEGGKLTLTGVAPNSIVFADRPVRAAGHVMTEQFIMQWDEGKDSFAKDPPNATVSVLGGDGSKISDAVVTLKAPKLEGGNLSFDVVVLEGTLPDRVDRLRCSSTDSVPLAVAIFRAGGFEGARFGGTVAARGPVAAIGTLPSITVLGMGRAPGRRLALPPELRGEQPITHTSYRISAGITRIPRASDQGVPADLDFDKKRANSCG